MRLIFVLMMTAISYGQTLPTKWYIDLDNDSIKDRVQLVFDDSTYFLKINTMKINLNSSVVETIADEKNKDNVLIIDDIDNDKEKEIIVNMEDPIFYNKSILKIFKVKNKEIVEQAFLLDYEEKTNEIISFGKIVVYNHYDKSLYIKVGTHIVQAVNNETMFYHKIILLRWNKYTGCMMQYGEKYYKDINYKYLNKIIWDRNN